MLCMKTAKIITNVNQMCSYALKRLSEKNKEMIDECARSIQMGKDIKSTVNAAEYFSELKEETEEVLAKIDSFDEKKLQELQGHYTIIHEYWQDVFNEMG